MICTYYLSDGVSMVTETSGTRTGTLDSEYENIGIIPIYFVFHCPLGPRPWARCMIEVMDLTYVDPVDISYQQQNRKDTPYIIQQIEIW